MFEIFFDPRWYGSGVVIKSGFMMWDKRFTPWKKDWFEDRIDAIVILLFGAAGPINLVWLPAYHRR